ncbi:MAG: MFS transporter [Chloroflexota bacterium]|nr:MFS transporter [Chloroflexota bacterium]
MRVLEGVSDAPGAKRINVSEVPRVIKRNTLLLATSQAIVGIGNQMVPTLTALMIEQLLRSATFAGLGYSALGLSRFLVAYPLGQLSDRRGRKAGLMLGLVVSLVGSLGLTAAQVLQSFPLFCAALLVFGLGVGAAQQLRLAAADMFPPHRRAEGLGYVLTGSLVGAMGGPVLITLAQAAAPGLGLDPIATSWLFVPALILPTILLVALLRPDPRTIALNLSRYYPGLTAETIATDVHEPSPAARTLFNDASMRVATANSVAAYGTMSMMMALTPLSMSHHGATLQEISLSVALHVVGMFAFSLPLGWLADRVGRRNILIAGGVISAVGAVLVPFSEDYWLATAGIFLVGVGWSCANVAATAIIADTTAPRQRGRAIGINDALSGAASIATPILGGLLVQFVGMPSLAIASVVLLSLPLVMTVGLQEHPRKRPA